jgi:hypothetical protein
MIKKEAFNIAGKNVVTYSPRSNKCFSPDDITQFLRKFQLNKALVLIGQVSYNLFGNSLPFKVINGTPISDSILAYIATKLIEGSNDYRSRNMTIDDLLFACDMYFGMTDPLYEDDGVIQSLTRFGMQQLDFDREVGNSLPRTLAIYKKLWNKIDSNKIDINETIQKISGLDLEEALFLSYVFSTISKQGYFHKQNVEEANNNFTKKFLETLQPSKQKAFINWISCNYDTFRKVNKSQAVPDSSFDKYKFNNLFKYPIVIPDRKVLQGESESYIVPIRRLLYERISRGLYFDLTLFFSEEGVGNKFRESFGYVFQEYVGTLFRETIDYAKILNEWKYAKPNKMTPDWIILGNEKAILVEVKQSILYLQAKTWGELNNIKDNLKKTIGGAVNQLWKFERDIREYDDLEILSNCKTIERLIVTYDHSYFLNSVLHDLVLELHPDIPKNYFWHVISVEALERILGLSGVTLFKILEDKRLDSDGSAMDFRDYIGRKYEGSLVNNKYLNSIHHSFLEKFGVSASNLTIPLRG